VIIDKLLHFNTIIELKILNFSFYSVLVCASWDRATSSSEEIRPVALPLLG